MSVLGRTLRLFLVDGTPGGIVVAEIINWSGQIFRFPREQLSSFLERRESNRTGVYLLIGDDAEVPGRLKVYVGESDNIGARLRQHVNSEDKSFWEYTCAVTSKDQNLTKAHVLYLESQVLEKAISADRVTIENNQTRLYENMPESDVSDMTYFFQQLSVLFPALGIELFSPVRLQETKRQLELIEDQAAPLERTEATSRQSPLLPTSGSAPIEVVLRDSVFGIQAKGIEQNGEVLVLKGSQARGVNDNEVNVYKSLRNRLIKDGKLIPTSEPKVMHFASDVLFNSPSAASAVILDRNDNGRASWREVRSNKSLNVWYAEQANKALQPVEVDLGYDR